MLTERREPFLSRVPVRAIVGRVSLLGRRRTQAPPDRVGRFAVAAGLFHVGVVAALLLLPALVRLVGAAPPPPPREQASIEMVMEKTPTVGGSKPKQASAPTVSPDPTPTKAPTPLLSRNAEDTVAATASAASDGKPSPKADQAERAPTQADEASAAMPDVNLDPDADPGWGIATGPNIKPASPDGKVNKPPHYPRAAVERGEQGLVAMIVSVAPDGHPSSVQIVASSGYKTLDDEAVRTVSAWHFNPAVKDGQKVPSIFNQQIEFTIGDARHPDGESFGGMASVP